MIPEFVAAWNERGQELRQKWAEKPPEDYKALVTAMKLLCL